MGKKIVNSLCKYGSVFMRGASKTYDMSGEIKVMRKVERASIEKAWSNVGVSIVQSMKSFDATRKITK